MVGPGALGLAESAPPGEAPGASKVVEHMPPGEAVREEVLKWTEPPREAAPNFAGGFQIGWTAPAGEAKRELPLLDG